jgi:hypothetical protein
MCVNRHGYRAPRRPRKPSFVSMSDVRSHPMYRQLVSGLVTSACVAVALGACAADEEATGTFELDLVGQAPSGNTYVLSNAEITVTQVSTGNARVFRTDGDGDTRRFHADVLPGDYTVQLAPGWRLYLQGSAVPAAAVLTSPNPASASITSGGTTRVALQFTVGGDGVTLDSGNLDIEVGVDEPAEGSIGNRQSLYTTYYYGSDYLFGYRVDLAGDATLLRFGTVGSSNGSQCKIGLYRDSIDSPGALVAQSEPSYLGGQNEVAITPVELTRGRYWLMTVCNGSPYLWGASQYIPMRRISLPFGSPLPQTFPSTHEATSTAAVAVYAVVDFH